MKTFIKYIALMLMVSFFLVSCQKYIKDDYNVDPNRPADQQLPNILPSIEGTWAWLQGGDVGRYTSIFTQHHGGVGRQHQGFDSYLLNESDVNNSWNSTYATSLAECNAMIAKGREQASPHYTGVGLILSSMIIMTTTDLYGDIPYSQAFKGADDLNPTYDTQEGIYAKIQRDLDSAIVYLGQTSRFTTTGASDLIYGGSEVQWIKLANGLKARAYVHLGLRDPANYTRALAALDAGALTSNDDDAKFVFFATASNANPLWNFMDSRGDIAMGKFFIDLLNSKSDPRLPFYAEPVSGTTYTGSPAGNPDPNVSLPGAFYASMDSPVPLFTYAEQKFLEAEAAFQSGNLLRAATAHNDAVVASLNRVTGTASAVYVAANATETAVSITLEKIMTQKYIEMYTSPESFTDIRRTGFPALTPAIGNQLPARFPYAQSERLYNQANFPGQKTLFEKLWWDN